MKCTLAACLVFLAASCGWAQLINPDFEEWQGNDPVGWATLNQLTQAIEPSNTAYSGQRAARMMIGEIYSVSWLIQTIPITGVEDVVELEVHYAALPEGAVLNLLFISSPLDGNVMEVTDYSQQYQEATLVWEPYHGNDEYDTLDVWITLEAIDEPFVGSVLVDNVVLRGIRGQIVEPDAGSPLATGWRLDGVHPNPFNSLATVSFNLPSAGQVELGVYDLAGRRVGTIAGGFYTAGNHRAVWSPAESGLVGGIYIIRLAAGNHNFYTRGIYLR